jgi:hypothetical protein
MPLMGIEDDSLKKVKVQTLTLVSDSSDEDFLWFCDQ